jgi:hypothetical protein
MAKPYTGIVLPENKSLGYVSAVIMQHEFSPHSHGGKPSIHPCTLLFFYNTI